MFSKKRRQGLPRKRFLFFFIDGVGMGENDPEINPFCTGSLEFINGFFKQNPFIKGDGFEQDDCLVVPIDTCLDTEGTPQSATGQTALLTGLNPCLVTGRHIEAFPPKPLRKMIRKHSLLKVLKKEGFSVTSANTYSKMYFKRVKTVRWLKYSVSTLSIMAARVRFRMVKELLAGKSIFHDLTNRRLQRYHPEVPEISTEQAGKNLAGVVQENDFTMFEYFLTDMAGHSRRDEKWEHIVEEVDSFTASLIANLDLEHDTVLITSDHGNLEDISTGRHTRNHVPCIIFSKNAQTRAVLGRNLTRQRCKKNKSRRLK